MAETAAQARRRREQKAIDDFKAAEKKRKAEAAKKKRKSTAKPKPKAKSKAKAKTPAPKSTKKSAYQLLKGRRKQIDDAVNKAKKG